MGVSDRITPGIFVASAPESGVRVLWVAHVEVCDGSQKFSSMTLKSRFALTPTVPSHTNQKEAS